METCKNMKKSKLHSCTYEIKNKSWQKENNRSGTIDQFLELTFFFRKRIFHPGNWKVQDCIFNFQVWKLLKPTTDLVSILAPDRKKNGVHRIQRGKEMKRHISWGFPVKRLKFYRFWRKLAGMYSLARIWCSYYFKTPTFHKCE